MVHIASYLCKAVQVAASHHRHTDARQTRLTRPQKFHNALTRRGTNLAEIQTGKEPSPPDPRILRSREKIRQSFVGAMQRDGTEDLNVREVLAGSGVGSSTFYRHYTSKEDVIAEIARNEIEGLNASIFPILMQESNRVACLASAEHIEAHREVWLALTSHWATTILRQEFREAILHNGQDFVLENATIPKETAAAICATIFVELMTWWLRQSGSTSPFKLAECIERVLIKPIFTCW